MTRSPEDQAAPPASPMATEAHHRAGAWTQLPRRLVDWLEEVLGAEEPPSGLADEIWAEVRGGSEGDQGSQDQGGAVRTDLHAVWTAMTALSQEVKLQGRSFARLTSELQGSGSAAGPVTDTTSTDAVESMQRLAQTLTAEREAALRREGADQAWLETIETVLDVRDALARGLAACGVFLAEGGVGSGPGPASAAAPVTESISRLAHVAGRALRGAGHWLDPLPRPESVSAAEGVRRAREAAAALEKGCTLSLDRVDDLLRHHDVWEIPCQGERFDPRCMGADDVVASSHVTEPVVVEVYRPGYWQGDDVLRVARVKVARPVRGPTRSGKQENP